MRLTARIVWGIFAACVFPAFAIFTAAQGSYRAQVRGTVSDPSGAVMANVTVTITDTGTSITTVAHTDATGEYNFTGLRPSTYSVRVEAAGFRAMERTNVVLGVDQETTLNFKMETAGVVTTVEVSTAAPLLDTESATLGTDITNEYVKDIPLINRSFFGLTFLSAGVTETAGSGTQDNYPTGTNFVSNGQRNATAEVRIDGALISAPEQGEGATSNVYYEPSVEIIQEFKVENNSFSAEFGSNGGTVVNMVLKSGTNAFHGSGWWFGQRSGSDARDFFNPEPGPKPNHERDQYGFSVGGPIKKSRTFFFADFEKVRDNEPINIVATVPTMAERTGDFSATQNPIYDPTQVQCTPLPNQTCTRPQVMYNGALNVIPPTEIDKIGQAIINLYPQPTPSLSGQEFNNFRLNTLSHAPDNQFDIKLDHDFSDKHRINGRYSRLSSNYSDPTIFGDGEFNDGITTTPLTAQNISFEYTWTMSPRIIWTSRFAVDRVVQDETTNIPSLTSVNLPTVLEANGVDRMPTIQMSGASPWTSLYDQCCLNTNFAHTLYSYSSQLVFTRGSHLMKFGGEQRIFFNNFFQPPNPTGLFNFTDDVTSQIPNSGAGGGTQGNPFASLLFGYADNSSVINIYPAVATKSKETGLYFQDDWRVNSKLTLNLGLRYEWSTPYTMRHNLLEFSDFTGSSGMSIDLTAGGMNTDPNLGTAQLSGTTLFPTSGTRSVPVDRNNIGPRIGVAYQLTPNTVIRGGAGVYYGMSVATNFQYPGTAFRKSATMFFTTDNFATQSAFLNNPFPNGLTGPQGKQYGPLAEWGYANANDLGTSSDENADIYQWNLGVQRLLPSQIVIGVDYSANRSIHLPWGGNNVTSTRNRDFISSSLLSQVSAQQHALDLTCDTDSCVSNYLANPVTNPFCSLFSGTQCTFSAGPAIFNEPDSQYGNAMLPLINLLRPYPQFDGDFEGLPLLEAASWYNSLQIRFQKKTTHGISFEGNYTFSKLEDDASAGANAFIGTLNQGNAQQLDRLNKEWGISANDTPQRLAAAVIVDLPLGRGRWLGADMNRLLDGIVGGWSISTLVTAQSGQPLWISMGSPRLADGNQRPNVLCGGRTGIGADTAAIQQTPFLNINCFADPGDQIPGDAPRYFSSFRTDGIHNVDSNLYKEFVPKEGMKIQLRAEFYNLFNHPRFAAPNTAWDPGNSQFGIISSTAPGYLPRRLQIGVRFEF